MKKKIIPILSKCWQGQPKKGVHDAPFILFPHIHDKFPKHIDECHILEESSFVNPISGYNKLYDLNLLSLRKKDSIVLNIGGDHSIAGPTVAASQKIHGDDLRVVWIDAHADVNTYDSSPSGNYHGMPLASALHLFQPWVDNSLPLKPHQIIYIGLRDIDEFEQQYIKDNNISYYTIDNIDTYGLEHILEQVQEMVYDKPVHLSFDIDSMDPTIAPSTGTPVENGLELHEVNTIHNRISLAGDIINCDFVEFNPNLGTTNKISLTKQTNVDVMINVLDQNLK